MIASDASTPVASRRVRALTLAAACLALFAIFLDNTIVNVAVPAIQRDLGSAPDQLEWTVNAYVVAFAGLVLLGGKLGDRLGRRKMFVAGLLLFAAGSAAGGLSASSAMLIGSRAVQGAGAALLAPLSLSLLAQVFHRRELPHGHRDMDRCLGSRAGHRAAGWRTAGRALRLARGVLGQRADRPAGRRADPGRSPRVGRHLEQENRCAGRHARHRRPHTRRGRVHPRGAPPVDRLVDADVAHRRERPCWRASPGSRRGPRAR